MTEDKPSDRETARKAKRRESWMKNAAVYYLGQHASSAENLRRVLLRKAARRLGEEVPEDEIAAMVDETVAYCRTHGFINDAEYTEMKVAAGGRRGHSKRRLNMMLEAKGIAPEAASAALAGFDDLAAAVRYARKRRLGPWRAGEPDVRKDVASLARQGFGPDVAFRVARLGLAEAEDMLFGPQDG
ncbi:regulatory protein RecX [Xanthobacteraceae bacterium A53D]